MKKLIYVLPLLLILFGAKAQEQKQKFDSTYETMVDTTKQWAVVQYWHYDEQPFENFAAFTTGYRFKGDTLIEGKLYKFLEECKDSLFQDWYRSKFLFRDDSANRVYIHDYNTERVLYDYNIEVGDTVWIPCYNDFEDTCFMNIFTGKIDTIAFANKNRINVTDHIFMPSYVKGFGTFEGPLGMLYADNVANCYWVVTCFKQHGEILYSNADECDIHFDYLKVDENTAYNKTKVYPNPAINNFTIEYLGSQSIVQSAIYSMDGKCLFTKKTKTNNETIEINTLQPGIYLVKITLNNQKQCTHKLIKK